MSAERLFDSLEPRSRGQEELKRALLSKAEIVGIFGPTGTGKSLFALLYAISSTQRGKFKRLVVSRPIIDVVTGKEMTLYSDPEDYVKHSSEYLRDLLAGFTETDLVGSLMSAGKLILADPHFLRGRTFDDAVIILDDAQSVPIETTVEIVTRMGKNSRLIIAGDPVFQRSAEPGVDGASMARDMLLGEENAAVVDLGLKDIVRPGARRGVKMLLELQMRKRQLTERERSIKDAISFHAPDADVVTVVDLGEALKMFENPPSLPDALIVVKEGHLGRLIGSGGERIQRAEKDLNMRLRGIEASLDLRELIGAVHPVSRLQKHIVDVDFAGNYLQVVVSHGHLGMAIGQRGLYARLIDWVTRRLLRVGTIFAEEHRRRHSSS